MTISRRRFIKISAYCGATFATSAASELAPNHDHLYHWKGISLGAESSIKLYHHSKEKAHSLKEQCIKEISRLEGMLSLFNAQSTLSTLNHQGYINNPPPELVEILNYAHYYSDISDGAFDVTIQPLWKTYANSTGAPSKSEINKSLALVNYRNVLTSNKRVEYRKAGMSISLNGIAQGYITDKITALLRSKGMKNVLIELGEFYALGKHPNGNKWHIGIKDPENPKNNFESTQLHNTALATSGGYGTRFNGESHHIFNPHNGKSAHIYQSVSVIAKTATAADALSTTLSIMPMDKGRKLIEKINNVKIIIKKHTSV